MILVNRDEAPKVDAGGISSMVAYLKVYLDDSDWQWFGIRYKNDTDKKQSVADCKVTQITLDYDTITEEENHHGIKSDKCSLLMLIKKFQWMGKQKAVIC